MQKRTISFSPPDVSDIEKNLVIEALNSGWITTGPKTKEFERQITTYCGASRAVCLNSATAAMELTLRLLGIGPGDEVITCAYTFTASASVIAHVGAKIVLCDVAPGSYLIDVSAIEKLITNKTKAIIPVDIGGVICDYEALFKLAESKKHLFTPNSEYQEALGRIAIIADAAHSFGSIQNEKLSGSIADFTCFSFHAVKNLTTAEGGAVTWNTNAGIDDDHMYKDYMLLSLHGQSKDALAKTMAGAWEYDILTLGYKNNMTDIAAAFGLAQLSRYTSMQKRREQIAKIYDNNLPEFAVEPMCHRGPDFASNYHLYMVRVKDADEITRNKLITAMTDAGVATNVHFKPLPMFTAYKSLGFSINDFPNSYEQYKNEITLPLYSMLADDDAQYICSAFLSKLNEIRNTH